MMHRYTLGIALIALGACAETESPVGPAEDTTGGIELATNGPLLGKIAFSSYRIGNQSDIYVMNADGTGVTRLTSAVENEFSPAWSYDNQRIAFARPRTDGSNLVHQDIYVMDANGSNGHWVSPTANSVSLNDPEWSPDGSRIAVWTSDQELAWLDVATGELKYFEGAFGRFSGFFPSFDPSGQKVVFGGGSVLYIISANAPGKAFEIILPSNLRSRHPSFSPDGQRIVFSAARDDRVGAEIYSVGADGSGLTLLANSRASDTEPSWSPDGKQIAYASDRSGNYQIYRMNVTGGKRTLLGVRGVHEANPAYSH